MTVKPYLYGGIIARLLSVPCLVSAVSGLGSLFIYQDIKSKIIRFLLYPIYTLAFNHFNQTVILQNQEDANLLTEWGVLNRNKVQILKGSGVELENFRNF